MMEYKGYTASVEFDDEAGVLHGRVIDLRDVITFEATSVDELREEFKVSVDDYLAWCVERGEEPDRPFSGRFVLRLDPQMHRAASVCAGRSGVSLNDWMVKAVDASLNHERERDQVVSSVAREVKRTITKSTRISLGFEDFSGQESIVFLSSGSVGISQRSTFGLSDFPMPTRMEIHGVKA